MAIQGTWLGGQGIFKDRGWTEALASSIPALKNSTFVNPGYANTNAGKSLGLSNVQAASPSYDYSSARSTQGYPNPSPTGTPSAGGQVLGGQSGGSPPQESAPQQGGIDYDALIRPALDALEQSIAPAQSGYEADVAQIDANRAKGRGELEASLAAGQKEAERSRGRVTGQTESAVDEARRQFAEISQGLQARYGGTTGTGAFTEGLAGRQALQNIGQQRQSLTQAIAQIDDRMEQVRSVTELGIQDVEQQAEAQKQQAKAQLDNTLNSIRMAKGELLSRKVEYAQQAMQFYQQQVAQVEARNTAFKQQLFAQQQDAQNKLLQAKNSASDRIKQFEFVNINDNPFVFNPYKGTVQTPQGTPYGVGQMSGAGMGGQEDDFIDQQ